MRREGYELAVSRPEVIIREIDGVLSEPIEQLVVDMEEQFQGGVMERLGQRRGQLSNMEPDGKGRVRLDYMIPARGLIGFQTEFRTITAGTGLLFHVFDHYGPRAEGAIAKRQNGVMISNGMGSAPAYSLVAMQERGRLLVSEGDEIYEGQLVGIHAKDNDLTVNALRAKQMTNIRAAGKDENVQLTPPIKMSLEQALEFIEDDELVEVTPKAVRLRKKHLTENDRKRASRRAALAQSSPVLGASWLFSPSPPPRRTPHTNKAVRWFAGVAASPRAGRLRTVRAGRESAHQCRFRPGGRSIRVVMAPRWNRYSHAVLGRCQLRHIQLRRRR